MGFVEVTVTVKGGGLYLITIMFKLTRLSAVDGKSEAWVRMRLVEESVTE